MWPLWWPLPLKGLKKSHTKRGWEAWHAAANAAISAFTKRSLRKTGHQSISQRDNEGICAGRSRHTSKPHVLLLVFFFCVCLRVSGVFILQKKKEKKRKEKKEAGSIPKAALEFNQKKSSLSHKGKALKSYYNAQSLHCFSAKLQHTVRCLNANAN